MFDRIIPGCSSKTSQNMSKRAFIILPLVVAAVAVGCKDDPPNEATSPKPSGPKPSLRFGEGMVASARAMTAASSSAAPSASAVSSAAPEPPASASAAEPPKPAPSASAKAEAPKKDPAKPATTAATPPPATSASAIAAPAAPLSPADALAAQIDTVFLGKNTFSAKFKQEHTQKIAGVTKKSSGMFFFERPNKMSFRYDAPSTNRIVSDGKTLKVYIGEDKQMFVQSVEKTEYPGAFAFLMGKGMGPSFNFTFNEKAKFEGGPVLLGKPKEPTPHYDSVMFYVDKALLEKKDAGVVRRILLVDAQGNRNRFDLEGATQPEKIDPAEFTFTPPAGTNITQN